MADHCQGVGESNRMLFDVMPVAERLQFPGDSIVCCHIQSKRTGRLVRFVSYHVLGSKPLEDDPEFIGWKLRSDCGLYHLVVVNDIL
jgi:hypothetical protein